MLNALAAPPLQAAATAVAAAIAYLLLLAVTRVSRARLLARFTAADALLLLVLGAVIGRGILGAVPTLEEALIGAGVLVLLRVLVGLVSRSRVGRRLVSGAPLLLVAGGAPVLANLRAGHVHHDDLASALRRAGVARLGEVACAILETDGTISVTRFDPSSPLDPVLFAGVHGIDLVADRYFTDGGPGKPRCAPCD